MTTLAPALPATRFLGRYELMYLLGQGGMGEVHLARLTGAAGFEKLCIVKTILPQMMSDPQFVDRFHHEGKVLVQLNHSNIAQVYDMGDAEQTLYMAIEYVPGVDLARVEDRARAMGSAVPVPVALLIGQQMCEALGYAHRKVGADGAPLGIVHRDVSPQNVMVSYEGEVKVIDFGLAKSSARSKHTLPSTVLGKLGYMSPEQARAEKVDHRSDIYSAGIVVWELLAGRPFINGGTVGEMVAMMANPKIPNLRDLRPEVSEAVEKIVVRALQPDPNARYSRGDDFARALNEQLVRENLVVGSEDVGNYVRAMCPEEFAAERQLQSRLSLMRKKGGSSPDTLPKSPPIEGTFLRAPASGAAIGIEGTQVRTPLPPGSSPSAAAPLTAAQRALSTVQVAAPSQPAYAPGAQVPSQPRAPQQTPSQVGLSGEYVVPKSRAPMIVVLLFLFVAIGVGGFYAYKEFVLGAGSGGDGPLVVEPPPLKKDPVAEKVDPAPEQPEKPVAIAKVDPAPEKVEKTDEPQVKKEVPAALERVEVKPPLVLWKIIRDGDKAYVQVTGKPKLREGDAVKVLGPAVAKDTHEVYAVASIVEVKGSLARLLVDEDVKFPPKAFAVKELGPKRERPVAMREPGTKEPAAKVEPVKVDEPVAKVEPTKVNRQDPPPEQTKIEKPEKVEKTEKTEKVEVPPANKPKVLTGGIVVGSGMIKKVHIFNRTDYAWHGCELRLPTKQYFRYDPEDEIGAGESDGIMYSKFKEDTRPVDPQFANGWALVRCREGVGYVQFKAN